MENHGRRAERTEDEWMLKRLEGLLGSWREPIPPRFERAFEGRPFEACDYCAKPLQAPGTTYMINKYYENGELKQETAMCRDCRKKLKEHYSQASLEYTTAVFSGVDRDRRLELASDESVDRVALMTERCLLCEAPRAELSEYFEYAYCEAAELVFYQHPMMICGACALRIFDGLSAETKEARRRFYAPFYGLPPDSRLDERADNALRRMMP